MIMDNLIITMLTELMVTMDNGGFDNGKWTLDNLFMTTLSWWLEKKLAYPTFLASVTYEIMDD